MDDGNDNESVLDIGKGKLLKEGVETSQWERVVLLVRILLFIGIFLHVLINAIWLYILLRIEEIIAFFLSLIFFIFVMVLLFKILKRGVPSKEILPISLWENGVELPSQKTFRRIKGERDFCYFKDIVDINEGGFWERNYLLLSNGKKLFFTTKEYGESLTIQDIKEQWKSGMHPLERTDS